MHNDTTAEILQNKLCALDVTVTISREKSMAKRKQSVRTILTWSAMSFLCVLLSYAVLSSWKLALACFAITVILACIAGIVYIATPNVKRSIRKDVEAQLADIQNIAHAEKITLNIPKNLVRYL